MTQHRRSSKHRAVRPNDRGQLSLRQLESIHTALEKEGVFALIRQYRNRVENTVRPRGRPESISVEAFLTLTTALIENGDAPLLANVAQALRFRLSLQAARALGIPDDVYALERDPQRRTYWDVKGTDDEDTVTFFVSPENLYDRVQSANDRLSVLVEPYPNVATRHARPIHEVEADIALLVPEEVAAKHARLDDLLNGIVRASTHRFARRARRHFMRNWGGSVAIDGTKVPVYCTDGRGGVPIKQRAKHPEWLHHPEAMASYHVRTGNHAGCEDDGVTPVHPRDLVDSDWAYESHFAVACGGPTATGAFPEIALGISFDSPAGRIGENSLTALKSATIAAAQFGKEPAYVVADRAILPNAKFSKFQQPARNLGWRLVMDYRKDQLGKLQAQRTTTKGPRRRVTEEVGEADPLRGLAMIEGDFYCPGIPDALADAEQLVRDHKIDLGTWRERVQQRQRYLATRKEQLNADGRARFACPATTLGGHLTCPLRPGAAPDNKTRTRVEDPPVHPGEVCTTERSSVAITLQETTGKYAQDLRFGTAPWAHQWGQRNVVEGFNKSVKEENHENLGEGKRRRVRGFAKQAILVALMVFSANVRHIRKFISEDTQPEPEPVEADERHTGPTSIEPPSAAPLGVPPP